MNAKTFRWMAALVLSALLSSAAQAAETKAAAPDMQAMMAKMKEAGTPGPEHAVLKSLEGEWTTTTRSWMKPGDKAQQSEGTSSIGWVLGGRFLNQKFKGNWGGEAFEGLGFIGYDKVMKEYVSTWMDSMSTSVARATGQYDAATKTLKDNGSFSCPIEGKPVGFRSEWKIVNNDQNVFSMFMKDTATGKEFKGMEITYKRAK